MLNRQKHCNNQLKYSRCSEKEKNVLADNFGDFGGSNWLGEYSIYQFSIVPRDFVDPNSGDFPIKLVDFGI